MLSILILGTILGLSFLGILFIILRNYPKMVLSHPEKFPVSKKRESLEKIKLSFQYFLAKFQERIFHRFRIFTLKIDNKINLWLENLRKKRFSLFLKKKISSKKSEKT